MLTRLLGRSELEISAMGLGCWAIGGPWTWAQPGEAPFPEGWGVVDDAESIRAVHAGLDAGITFFDTAANYGAGHSERMLGQALRGRRHGVVIATKFGHIIDEAAKTVFGDDRRVLTNLRRDIEASLQRLDTDYVDLYQLHAGDYPAEDVPALLDALEDLVAEGKIRWYGWSTDLVDRARLFAAGPHCTAIQFRLNAAHDDPSMRALLAAFNLAGINKDPLNKGILTGKFTSATTFPSDDVRSRVPFSEPAIERRLALVEALRPLLTSGGRTMAQGALAYIWALDPRLIPIPGFRSAAQVVENAAAMQRGPLSQRQVNDIQAIVKRHGEA